MAKPVKTSLFEKYGHGGDLCLGQDVPVWYLVLPRDGENPVKATHMEDMEPSFLVSLERPCLTGVQERAHHTGPVRLHFGVLCEFVICPHPYGQSCEDGRGFSNSPTGLCLHRQGVWDDQPEIHDFVESLKFVGLCADVWGTVHVLAHDLCLFDTDG